MYVSTEELFNSKMNRYEITIVIEMNKGVMM